MDASFAVLLFFFKDPAATEIYTLSLHDALPISVRARHAPDRERFPGRALGQGALVGTVPRPGIAPGAGGERSEEHTSELQSQSNLVCRLLLENKKKHSTIIKVSYVVLHVIVSLR